MKKATGSDKIKQEIVLAYSDTQAADWKRRTRTTDTNGISRRFEHVDGQIVETLEKPDGSIEITHDTAGSSIKLMEWDQEYVGIEIYISGPQVDEVKPDFDEFEDNPKVTALFLDTNFYDEEGDYNGDGCDRLEINKDYLYAAMDGPSKEGIAIILKDCLTCAKRYPDLSYMVIGWQPVGDDEVERCDVLLLRGFNAANNPVKRHHGRFFSGNIIRGI